MRDLARLSDDWETELASAELAQRLTEENPRRSVNILAEQIYNIMLRHIPTVSDEHAANCARQIASCWEVLGEERFAGDKPLPDVLLDRSGR